MAAWQASVFKATELYIQMARQENFMLRVSSYSERKKNGYQGQQKIEKAG